MLDFPKIISKFHDITLFVTADIKIILHSEFVSMFMTDIHAKFLMPIISGPYES